MAYRAQSNTNTFTAADVKTYSSSSSSASSEPLQYFDNGNRNTCRPIIFKPTGSFRVLKETGKMACGPGEEDLYKGFVRGSQHNAGRTFGAATRRALATDYRDMATSDPLPQSPQQNTLIAQTAVKDSFIEQLFGDKQYMLPGYTGFVPGVRPQFGESYGNTTNNALKQKPLSATQTIKPGFAAPALPLQLPEQTSNPLPGGALTHDAPDMFIPAHIKYLTYIAQ